MAIFFTIGGYGVYKNLEMLVKAIKKVRFKLTWKPIIAVFGLIGIILGAVFYYVPFWYMYLGFKPTYGPYLAIHGNGGMQVSWDTVGKTESIVLWGDSPTNLNQTSYGGSFYWENNTTPSEHHCVILNPLEDDTEYYYKVPSLSNKVHHFKTPPDKYSGKKLGFTILGDTQGAYNIQKQNIANMIANHGVDGINFTIICGDNVNQDDDIMEWTMLFDGQSYGRITKTVPWMASSGNHEVSSEDDDWPPRQNFKKFHQNSYLQPNSTIPGDGALDIGIYYSFNYSNIHFTILDTHQYPGTHNLSAAQMTFLENDLANVNNTNMWKFLAFHVPMYSTSVRGGSIGEEDLAHQLEPILYKYQVDAVFYGHDHIYEAWHVNATESYGGTYTFLCAGGGGSLKNVNDPDAHTNPDHAWDSNINIVSDDTEGHFDDIYGYEWQLYGERTHHYMHVEVEGDQAIFSAYRTTDNSLIKAYTVSR
jgi:hypothetical protein